MKAITVWPDEKKWIVSLDDLDEYGGADGTTTLSVQKRYYDAVCEAVQEGFSRDLPVFEQTGIYGFSRPLTMENVALLGRAG